MAISKVPTLPAVLAAVLIALAPLLSSGADRWTTFTSLNDVRQMRVINDSLYVATSGGLLVVDDPAQPGLVYDNLSGLGTVDIHDVMQDAQGAIWVAGFGRLIRISQSSTQQFFFMDNDGKLLQLYSLADDGDNIWVGSQVGLILFSKTKDGGQIQDSYDLFASLNPSPTVYDIALVGDSIWLATSAGVAVADKSNPINLNAPATWTGFSPGRYPQLGSSQNLSIERYDTSMFVGGPKGAFRFQFLPTDTVLAPIDTMAVSNLAVEHDTLWIYDRAGLLAYANGTGIAVLTPGLNGGLTTGAHLGTTFWPAAPGGLYSLRPGESAAKYPYTGAPSNQANAVVAFDGVVTAGFGNQYIAQFSDGSWHTLTTRAGDGVTTASLDSAGGAWVAAIGEGVWRVTADSLKNFDETNSTLRGNRDLARYVFVTGISCDDNYVFFSCLRALNGYPVAFCRLDRLDTPSAWDSLGFPDGITDTFVTNLDFHDGQVAVATQSSGVFWYFFGPDVQDKSDDYCRQLTKLNSELRSDAVRVVKFAPDGTLWVGTNFGLSRWDAGIDRFVDVDLPAGIGPFISGLAIDTRGNVWAASTNGLAFLDAASGKFTVYTSLTSGLVADDIRSVALDPVTGDLYVGTSSGISVHRSAIATPTQNLDSVFAFPNPYVISRGSEQVNFNFARPYTVRIFDVAGALIRENIVTGPWDGRNQQGERVASGVYIFVLQDTEGNVTRGKILVINRQ